MTTQRERRTEQIIAEDSDIRTIAYSILRQFPVRPATLAGLDDMNDDARREARRLALVYCLDPAVGEAAFDAWQRLVR